MHWKEEVDQVVAAHGSPIPMILAVNKVDLVLDDEAGGKGDEEQTAEFYQQYA